MAEQDKRDSIGGRGKRRGLERTVVALEPEQVEIVRKEAMRRMVERNVGRMDSGEVVREAVATWVERRDDPVFVAQRRAEELLAAWEKQRNDDALAAKVDAAIAEFQRLVLERSEQYADRLNAKFKRKGGKK